MLPPGTDLDGGTVRPDVLRRLLVWMQCASR